MSTKIVVTAGIVTYNNQKIIEETIRSILSKTQEIDLKLFVFDNCSADDTVKTIEQLFPHITILKSPENKGFGFGHNAIIERALQENAAYHVIINPDILFLDDALSGLVGWMQQHTDVQMAMPKIIFPNGEEQHLPKRCPKLRYLLGGRFERLGKPFSTWRNEYTMKNETNGEEPYDIDFCTGCFMLIRGDALKQGLRFDECYFLYLEDADLSRQVKQNGGRVVFVPQYSVAHAWQRESHKKLKYQLMHIHSMLKYFMKWRGVS